MHSSSSTGRTEVAIDETSALPIEQLDGNRFVDGNPAAAGEAITGDHVSELAALAKESVMGTFRV